MKRRTVGFCRWQAERQVGSWITQCGVATLHRRWASVWHGFVVRSGSCGIGRLRRKSPTRGTRGGARYSGATILESALAGGARISAGRDSS
jgi:hypothetical protein